MHSLYDEAVIKERWLDEQRRWQNVLQENEASWGLLEWGSSDGVIYRWCGLALLRLGRSLVALGSRMQAETATPGA